MSDRIERNGKSYLGWQYAGGPNECAHGYAAGIPCPDCDAASRLTETKLPSSPAGEMEKEPACSWCFKRLRDCKCMETGSGNYTLPAEPLNADISGPKGSGGAAPEFVATDPMKFACSWCGVLAGQPCGDIGIGRWIGDIHFDRAFHAQECDNRAALSLLATKARGSKSAAPIAPAAQEHTWTQREADFFAERNAAWELVQELVDSLKAVREEWPHNAPADCYATGPKTGDLIQDLIACPGCTTQRKIDAALARAERKEGEAKHG